MTAWADSSSIVESPPPFLLDMVAPCHVSLLSWKKKAYFKFQQPWNFCQLHGTILLSVLCCYSSIMMNTYSVNMVLGRSYIAIPY